MLSRRVMEQKLFKLLANASACGVPQAAVGSSQLLPRNTSRVRWTFGSREPERRRRATHMSSRYFSDYYSPAPKTSTLKLSSSFHTCHLCLVPFSRQLSRDYSAPSLLSLSLSLSSYPPTLRYYLKYCSTFQLTDRSLHQLSFHPPHIYIFSTFLSLFLKYPLLLINQANKQ